jgi:hypothetical protein
MRGRIRQVAAATAPQTRSTADRSNIFGIFRSHRRAALRKTRLTEPWLQRESLRFRWRGGFCGLAGFRRCAACGCWTTGKIFVRGCEDIVFDE